MLLRAANELHPGRLITKFCDPRSVVRRDVHCISVSDVQTNARLDNPLLLQRRCEGLPQRPREVHTLLHECGNTRYVLLLCKTSM